MKNVIHKLPQVSFPVFHRESRGRERVVANRQEFKQANKILHRIKVSDGRIAVHDVLDQENISLWWWKDHKSWFLERFPYIRIEFDSEEEHPIKYFINTEMIDN